MTKIIDNKSWLVFRNGHTAQCTSDACVVWHWQCKLVSSWGLRKQTSAMPYRSFGLWRTLRFLDLHTWVSQPQRHSILGNENIDIFRQRSVVLCHPLSRKHQAPEYHNYHHYYYKLQQQQQQWHWLLLLTQWCVVLCRPLSSQ